MADIVQACGGSSVLLNILNTLGCTTSYDTHSTFVRKQVEVLEEKSVSDELSPHAFTVCSVDNFDLLQSHATVYCGDLGRSYHGTTVQIVQPNHSLMCTIPECATNRRMHSGSPSSSPHQLGKEGPKRHKALPPTSPDTFLHVASSPTLHLFLLLKVSHTYIPPIVLSLH